jgi:hypothetical protein
LGFVVAGVTRFEAFRFHCDLGGALQGIRAYVSRDDKGKWAVVVCVISAHGRVQFRATYI